MKSNIYGSINYRFVVINVPNILNVLIPIFLLPIVISSTGIEDFGKLIFYQGVIGILLIISENGLNTISLSEFNEINSDSLVYHVITIKILISLVLFGLILFFIPANDIYIFLILYLSVFGQAINISYLYIFRRNETVYSILLFGVKIISTIIYLGYIKTGILSYALFLGVGDVLIGLSSIIFSGCLRKIFFSGIDTNLFKYLCIRGFNYTKINLLSSGYSQALPIYLKFFLGFEIIGVYGAIEKIFRGFSNISAPFNLILLGESNLKSIHNFFEIKQVKLFFGIFILTLIFVGLFAENIMNYFISDVDFDTYRFSFLISLLIPVVVFFSRIFVVNFYVKNSLEKKLFPIYLSIFFISIPLNLFSIYFFGLFGCIVAALMIELLCLYKLITNLRLVE